MRKTGGNLVEQILSGRLWTRLILAGLTALCLALFLFPFASYTYRSQVYTLTGLEFLTGATVCGGKVVIETGIPVILILAGLLLILAGTLLNGALGKKLSFGLLTIGSIVSLVGNITFAMDLKKVLRRAKSPGVNYGSILILCFTILTLVLGLYILWRLKVLVTIDFMVLPGMLYFIINNYIPMFGITIAFKKVDYSVGVWKSPWVGLSNFKMLFAHNGSFFQSDAFLITRNTLLYNATFIILGILMGVIVGICLADIFSRALQKFFQTSILLPQLISMVIVAYIVYALLSNETGMVNHLLGEGNEINFYQKSVYWPFILVFIYVWKQVGYNSIIFLSSIVSIDHSIYEAAKVDGASKWQQIRFVTLPMLKPTVITLMLLQVGRIFYSDFGLFYQVPLDSGALYNVTNTVDTYVYRCLMVLNNVSVASAGSTYQAIVGFVLVFTVNMLVRRYDRENALF